MSRLDMTLFLVFLSLAGCTRSLGYAGVHPGYIECKGKGVITGTGVMSAVAGVGGVGANSFTLQADCGEGFRLQQGAPPVDSQNQPIKSK